MEISEELFDGLPDAGLASRFFNEFIERNRTQAIKLQKNNGLLSDVLTLAAYSPILATTLVQNPDYVWWLNRKRSDSISRNKEELLESLARFALTNSQLETQVLLARFRRRELLRIFLRDIRRLGTVAEITEEISNLADAILENALRIARQEMDNRYGSPLEIDEKGKKRPSSICIVSLGKLGSKELNYSSDIDLLFAYSADGETTGTGSRGSVTNREYFVKLVERVIKIVGDQTGEGAAYRVDLRLRPYGRVGPLATSVADTVRYYSKDARPWERQVLIRSRASAGDSQLYSNFFDAVEHQVFSPDIKVETALRNVLLSKERIDSEQKDDAAFDVKLGRGGIREIEFIAQALQLAYGGNDRWLRAPHTLISLDRLKDRSHITEAELIQLSAAYTFLRHIEHLLQMENGLQTHKVLDSVEFKDLVARRARLGSAAELDRELRNHTDNVHAVFSRVFSERPLKDEPSGTHLSQPVLPSPEVENSSDYPVDFAAKIRSVSVPFAEMLDAKPTLHSLLKNSLHDFPDNYRKEFDDALDGADSIQDKLSSMRRVWSESIFKIGVRDILKNADIESLREAQTKLAQASVVKALDEAAKEVSISHADKASSSLIAVALGKLGSGTLDYKSDLDLVIVHDGDPEEVNGRSNREAHAKTVEVFVNLLSSITREGNLYRVDLRLRPYGKNGPLATSQKALTDYLEKTASIWELLAWVQSATIFDGSQFATQTKDAIRHSLRLRASIESQEKIRAEAREVRRRLELLHDDSRGGKSVNLKFGAGGLLDVYFVVRALFLIGIHHLDDSLLSTQAVLNELKRAGLLDKDDYAMLADGHSFLTKIDHNLRLVVGRTSQLPIANSRALDVIATRMNLESTDRLIQDLTEHRLNIRQAFDRVLGPTDSR